MIDALPAFTAASLLRRNLWLIRLRWYASLGLLAGILGTLFLLPGYHDPKPLAAILIILVLSNLVYLYITRVSRHFTKERLVRLLSNQMMADLFLLSFLIYLTGGIESPLAFFYVFHIIIASIIFPGTRPYFYAAVAVLLYSTLLTLEYIEVIPHVCFYPDVHVLGKLQILVSNWSIFLTTIFASAYLAKSMTDRHRKVREQMELANRKLQEVNHSKVNFFRVSSHEMKSPISTMISTLMVIRDVLGDEVDDRVRDMAARSIKKGEETIMMLKDLSDLTYGSIQENKEFEQLDLCQLITEIIEELKPNADQKQIEIGTHKVADSCQYVGDPTALRKVFLNLINNAIRYTLEGGNIQISLKEQGVDLLISVKDTGIGIPPDEQKNIFQEFYRTPDARRSIEEGTGLGLAIVQRMVELHGGRVELESDVDQGSTFTVALPRVEAG